MTSWHRKAACIGEPLEVFFGVEGKHGHTWANEEHARRICGQCPVRAACLADATRDNEYGFWGGLTENERKRKRRRDNRTRLNAATTEPARNQP